MLTIILVLVNRPVVWLFLLLCISLMPGSKDDQN